MVFSSVVPDSVTFQIVVLGSLFFCIGLFPFPLSAGFFNQCDYGESCDSPDKQSFARAAHKIRRAINEPQCDHWRRGAGTNDACNVPMSPE